MRDRYDIRSEFPEFDAVEEHHCRYLALTTDSGTYVVLTDKSGSDYPTADDFMVCVYRSEDDFCEDPTDCLLGEFSSDNFPDIEYALWAAECEGVR